MGWQVRAYVSGEQFLHSEDIESVACLISDVRMPVMNGLELHDALTAAGHRIPTIFVTAFPSPSLFARLIAADVLAVLEKPLDAATLADLLASIPA